MTGPEARFGPDRRLTAALGLGCVIAATAAALTSDKAGRLLFGCAAVVLACYVVADLVFSPRLVVNADGLIIRSPLVRTRLAWTEVNRVDAVTRVRHGLRGVSLEIDAGELLVVFGRRSLGADPERVAAAVRALDPR